MGGRGISERCDRRDGRSLFATTPAVAAVADSIFVGVGRVATSALVRHCHSCGTLLCNALVALVTRANNPAVAAAPAPAIAATALAAALSADVPITSAIHVAVAVHLVVGAQHHLCLDPVVVVLVEVVRDRTIPDA